MILLDTHALVWWREASARLSPRAQAAIANEEKAGMIIVATAITMNIPLVTVDQKIRAYPHVQTIW